MTRRQIVNDIARAPKTLTPTAFARFALAMAKSHEKALGKRLQLFAVVMQVEGFGKDKHDACGTAFIGNRLAVASACESLLSTATESLPEEQQDPRLRMALRALRSFIDTTRGTAK